ncbi:MAG: DUF4838 domain-containing protein [Fimbriimonas sp.]
MILLLGIVTLAAPNQIIVSASHLPAIIVAPDATGPEKLAAKELAHWLGAMAGRSMAVTESFLSPANSILVGQSVQSKRLFKEVPFDQLGDEEIVLRSKGSRLLVAGGRPRGTVYAVNRLLHLQGIRWWTPWATHVPRKSTLVLKDLAVREKPVFESRSPFWFHAFDRDWARRNNSNGMHARLTDEDGGKITYEGFVHTFYDFVPPAKHFKDHPEWFSLIDGKRKWEGAQLCTTNPELRDFFVEIVREKHRKNPSTSIVSVSQNDWYGACQCANCKAIDDREGTPAGSVLTFANYVAEKIEAEFPKVAIDTLAYQYTRKAPKTLKPRHNVIVRLCSIECNFAQPLAHPSNKAFAADIKDWSRLTDRLYIWNYVTDFSNYMLPFPNWYTLGPNEWFFADNGVKGLFEQGAYQSFGSEMAEMEAWVQSQLLWNPRQDDKKLIREFLEGYYGKAAKPIQQYLDLMARAAKDFNLVIWTGPDAPFFTLDTMLEAERLWGQAEAAVAGDKDLLWRVRIGHLPVRFVFLSRWSAFRREALERKVAWPLHDSRKAVADQWLAVATGPGPTGWSPITHMNEGGTRPEIWAERFSVDPVVTPLPGRGVAALPAGLPSGEVLDFQDDKARLFGEGNLSELRADPLASDGIACRMPGWHHEWAFQVPLAKAPAGKYRVFVVARVESSVPVATGFTAGVYDSVASKNFGGAQPKVKEMGLGYALYEVGPVDVNTGSYIWVAPPGGEEVKAVWVDRVLLVKNGP